METIVTKTWELDLDTHRRLDVSADYGSIVVVPLASGEKPRLELRGRSVEMADVSVEAREGVTRVRARMFEDASGLGWSEYGGPTQIILHVPRNAEGRIHTQLGRILVRELHGCALEVVADGGAITLDRVTGALKLYNHVGKIDGDEVAGTFDVESRTGAVRLFVVGLDPGRHSVRTHVGSVRVELVSGLRAHVDARTKMGVSRVEVADAKDAPATLVLTAGMGPVRVTERAMTRTAVARASDSSAHSDDSSARSEAASAAQGEEWAGESELDRVLGLVETGKISAREASEILSVLEH